MRRRIACSIARNSPEYLSAVGSNFQKPDSLQNRETQKTNLIQSREAAASRTQLIIGYISTGRVSTRSVSERVAELERQWAATLDRIFD